MDIITTHINADFDSLGSIVAAMKLYPEAHVLFSGSQEKNLRNFLRDQPLTLPLVRFRAIDWSNVERVILVDVRNPSRLGEIAGQLTARDRTYHIYDHHPASEGDFRGPVEVIDDVGASVTLFCELLAERSVKLSVHEATVMALGIYEDTGNFSYQSTTPRDLRAAAWLHEQGLDLGILSRYTKKDLSATQLMLLHELTQSMETHRINDLDIVVAMASTEEYVSDLAMVAHKLDDMFSMSVFFLLVRMGDRLSMIARSRISAIDASLIARSFGGGGHPTAASASIKNMTPIEVKKRLLQMFNEQLTLRHRARDIMTAPVWTVLAADTLDHAATLMNRYSINNLPVEDNDRLIGIISRQTIDKAISHGLTDHVVREYMSSDLFPIEVDAPAFEARKIFIENNLRFMPVIDGRKVVGVITRTDILRSIYDEENDYREQPNERVQGKMMKNIASLLAERLPPDLIELLEFAGTVGDRLSLNVYIVGGFLRDLLLGRENFDVDLVVEGEVGDFARRLASGIGGRVIVHQAFNTAVIVCPDGSKIDIASARTEYYKRPGQLPTVEISSLKQDLYRRDFTINTLALKLNRQDFGILLDFFGSQRDIKDHIIRVLHGLSFIEDPTRVFRAIRFESRFGFTIGKQTLNFIQTAVSHRLFQQLSGNRLRGELVLMFQEQTPSKALARMNELGVLPFIHPEIDGELTVSLFERIREIILWHDYLYFDEHPQTWTIYMLGLVHSLADKARDEVCQRLNVTRKIVNLIRRTHEAETAVLPQLENTATVLSSTIHRVLSPLPREILLFLMARTERDTARRHISNYLTTLRWQKPLINGRDLINLDIPPGPHFQKIFRQILDLQLDGYLTNRDEAIAFIREKFPATTKFRS